MSRIAYIALALSTIAIGLAVHFGAHGLPAAVRDFTGDALWAVMMLWWMGAIAPRSTLAARAGAALGICLLVELSQAFHTPSLDAVRNTTAGHLVLGSGFDPRDLIAYACGVIAAAAIERIGVKVSRDR